MKARDILTAILAALPVDTQAEADLEIWMRTHARLTKKRRLTRRNQQLS
jgi:hypothetical protein